MKVLGTKLPLMEAKKSHLLGLAKKSTGKSSVKRRKINKESGDMDGFNALMMTIARPKNAELEDSWQTNDGTGKKVDAIVHLMENGRIHERLWDVQPRQRMHVLILNSS